MPFLDVIAPEPLLADPAPLAAALTDALTGAWAIRPEIVTTYLQEIPAGRYAHAGRTAPGPEERRVFVKLHAFPRDPDHKRRAAAAITDVFTARGVPATNVIVYFFDRPPHEAAHAGRLVSDGNA